jgi:nucleoside-diphosphate-sugar epimerase
MHTNAEKPQAPAARRILVTGASGFIGRRVVLALRGSGDEIHTVQHTARQMSDSRNHTVNLMEPPQVDRLMERVRPTHLMHLAWYAEHERFWTSPLNLDWVAASLHLFQSFVKHGGQRAIFSGSCAEYDWSVAATPASPLSHTKATQASRPRTNLTEDSPSNPNTLYGVCKNSLRQIIEKFSPIPVAWGRIFFLYGPGEHPDRLIPSIVNPLRNDQPAVVRSGSHIRNLMHVDDVARALVTILNSPATGIVNIAADDAVSLGDAARLLGELTGRSHLLTIEQAEGTPQNPLVLTADTAKLVSLGFVPRYSLREGLQTLLPSRESA